jgi:hypothetical protein
LFSKDKVLGRLVGIKAGKATEFESIGLPEHELLKVKNDFALCSIVSSSLCINLVFIYFTQDTDQHVLHDQAHEKYRKTKNNVLKNVTLYDISILEFT